MFNHTEGSHYHLQIKMFSTQGIDVYRARRSVLEAQEQNISRLAFIRTRRSSIWLAHRWRHSVLIGQIRMHNKFKSHWAIMWYWLFSALWFFSIIFKLYFDFKSLRILKEMEFALEVVTTVLEYFGWDRHEIEVSFFLRIVLQNAWPLWRSQLKVIIDWVIFFFISGAIQSRSKIKEPKKKYRSTNRPRVVTL